MDLSLTSSVRVSGCSGVLAGGLLQQVGHLWSSAAKTTMVIFHCPGAVGCLLRRDAPIGCEVRCCITSGRGLSLFPQLNHDRDISLESSVTCPPYSRQFRQKESLY